MSAIVIPGRRIAEERILKMRSFVESLGVAPRMSVLTVDPNAATRQFLRIKERVATDIGIEMRVLVFEKESPVSVIYESFQDALASHGVVVQLPFIHEVTADRLLSSLPADLDPDCIGHAAGRLLAAREHIIEPPVVAAIKLLCATYQVELQYKKVVVVGQGRLVGAPAALWFENQGASVTRVVKGSHDLPLLTREADIIVLGAGAPGILTPAMLHPDGRAIIFDAGTSEEGGKVVGDAAPECAAYSSLITPVPGGIGPLAVVELFGNMLRLQYDYQD